MAKTDSNSNGRKAAYSTAGLVIAFIALIAAVMSPWVMEAFAPPAKPIEERAVDVAMRIKARIIAKAKNEEFVATPSESSTSDPGTWYPPTTIGIGLIGVCLGVVGFTRHESSRVSASAVAVGLAAIVFQYFLLLAAAIIFVLLVGFILSALGIDLPVL